ncbi:pyridoxamine 5'-phosphate oxidase [Catenovulum agarivorans DS-2]|uniref:Pyridoxine/pyridoxamine 5'-phosphate oxidase n=1 Tax=Catenovulum agarivorans DS-2 TaxID=1328313 RepID=W7QSY0_9ALTE|nr:pyridoxamine 5'-phosphate oxidase [Catenovulum agarivorans]EWH08515.1 pyridoxamine 5'-phosphate oxidase [Catenovulum agarivorans DS-2]
MSIFYQVRREYALSDLSENDLTESPFELFETWLQQVMQIDKISDPTAMIVATVDEHGQSYQRTVLMKALDDTGVTFYTNKNSRKGQHLAKNKRISAIFPWLAAERQVVFSGEVIELSEAENDEYFASRPFESQIAAVASAQSEVIDSRESLEQKYHALVEQYQGQAVPRPQHWGGYKIVAEQVEFWQGGEFRMHDRFLYQRTKSNWKVCRLQP